jgi:hypothetical protein
MTATAVTRPVGVVTRGTTGAQRLRRVDRWLLAARPSLIATPGLLVVDLGFGASPVTTLELAARLRPVNRSARVVGVDIDPQRVADAGRDSGPVEFRVGGFELAGLRPHVVRAFNVLRQYDEADVAPAWESMTSRLAAGGLIVDGTCDETGRLGAWVTVAAGGPATVTLACDLRSAPREVATRLPKALIHRNVHGERIHDFLGELDAAWTRAAGLGVFGPRQRFATAVAALRGAGWPLLDGPRRWRRGEVTVSWTAVAPRPR